VSEARPLGRASSVNLNGDAEANVALRNGEASDTVSAEQALFAATLGGARALGLDHEIGSLREGMQADLTVVALDGAHQQPVTNPAEALIFSSSGRDVRMTMVAGKEIFRDGAVTTADELELQSRVIRVRDKLEQTTKGFA
jgi:cytosine/adenosine deaminase-related metal-dependent hydrolase